MGLTGKYDFPGFKKAGRSGASILFNSTPWLAWIPSGLRNAIVGAIAEWAANKGVVILNGAAYVIGGKLDSKALASALDSGIAQVDAGNVTPEQGKQIDDDVIKAAKKALPYGRKPTKP